MRKGHIHALTKRMMRKTQSNIAARLESGPRKAMLMLHDAKTHLAMLILVSPSICGKMSDKRREEVQEQGEGVLVTAGMLS